MNVMHMRIFERHVEFEEECIRMCGALVWRSAVARATHQDTSSTELALVRHSVPHAAPVCSELRATERTWLQRGLGTVAHWLVVQLVCSLEVASGAAFIPRLAML